jgi:hypothetical protein
VLSSNGSLQARAGSARDPTGSTLSSTPLLLHELRHGVPGQCVFDSDLGTPRGHRYFGCSTDSPPGLEFLDSPRNSDGTPSALLALQHGPADLISFPRCIWPNFSLYNRTIHNFHKEIIMKSKLLAIILAWNVMCWAQTTTPNPTPAPEKKAAPADAKSGCPCCEKMGHDHATMHKDMQACMHSKEGKDAMGCCSGKDSKVAASCCSGNEGKNAMACCHDQGANATAKDEKAASCCAGGKCEGKEMSCSTAKSGKSTEGCCGGNSCGKHEHAEHATSGN